MTTSATLVTDAVGAPAPAPPPPRVAPLPWAGGTFAISIVALVLADVVALAIAAGLTYVMRSVWISAAPYLAVTWGAQAAWLTFRAFWRLYPAIGIAAPDELRRHILTTTLAGVTHAVLLLAAQETSWLRFTALGIWALVLVLAWVTRGLVRDFLIRRRWFGVPVVVIGGGPKAEEALRELRGSPEVGLVPVAIFADDPALHGASLEGVPVVGDIMDAARMELPYRVRHAVVALARDEADGDSLTTIARTLSRRFHTLQLFPELRGIANLWVRTVPVGGNLVLEIPNARFNRINPQMKRAFDLALTIPALLVAGPIIGLAALAVKILSPGPAFFRQEREGRHGTRVRVLKIRTMVPNAEQRLAEFLANDPAARFEWERFLKLRKDPRIIPVVGGFLRRTSIDELPQLWHVLTGEMSLVGPRIFAIWHVERFSVGFRELRREVPPGITGLWQVKYRNSADLSAQELADSFYVHNWTLWLDLWILLRTVSVVVRGSGAY